MRCGAFCLTVLLLTSVLARATQAPPAPSPGFAAQPSRSSQLPVVAATPVITGYSPLGCISPGDRLNIVGRGFGVASGARGVALGGQGLHVDLPVTGWNDTAIQVNIPADPRIQGGQWYYAGVERADHGQWLSNIDRNFQICDTARTSVPATQVATGVPLPVAPSMRVPAQPLQGTGNTAPATTDPAASRSRPAPGTVNAGVTAPVPTGTGSLLGQALPAPPDVPAYTDRAGAGDSEPGELLVVSPDMTHALQVQETGQGLGLTVKRRNLLQGLGLVVTTFRVPAATAPAAAVQLLREQAPDLWTDVNHRYTLQGTDDARGYPARMLRWPENATTCGRGMRIGLVDGPLPERHAVLDGARITRHSVLTRGVQSGPVDHALAITGLLVGNAGLGLVPAAELYSAGVMRQRDGKHVDTTVEWIVQALDWLAQQQVALVNLSLGGPHNLILEAALQRLLDADIAVIAAAGNPGAATDPVYPAAQEGVVAVTALDAERRRYRQASRGDYITFAAPGVDIRVPRLQGEAYVSGTSFAAPYVTAILAVNRQLHPQSSWQELVAELAAAALDLGEPGRDPLYGYGLPQANFECK